MTYHIDPKALESAARNLKTLITIYDGQYDLNDNRRCHDMASATVEAYLKAAQPDGWVMVPRRLIATLCAWRTDEVGDALLCQALSDYLAAPNPPTPTEKE